MNLMVGLHSIYAWLKLHKEGLTAVGPFVAMMSAAFAILSAVVSESRARRHFRLSVEPLVHVRVGHSPEHHEIRIMNDGLGLAILKDVKCYIDGKQIPHKGGTRSISFIEMFSFHDTVEWDTCTIFTPREYYIRPGENIPCLILTLQKLRPKFGEDESKAIMRNWVVQASRMSIRIQYTSVMRKRNFVYESSFSDTLLHGAPSQYFVSDPSQEV